MCGILGFAGHVKEGQWDQTHRLLEALFLASEHRGQDASGFAAITCPYKSQHRQNTIVEKQPVKSSQFIKHNPRWKRLRHKRCSMVIGHVRWATHGAPNENNNNHPHTCRKGRWHIIHNGVIPGFQQIARRLDLHLDTDCDSEVLLRLIESVKNPGIGLELALQQTHGTLATAVLDSSNGQLWLARDDGRPLWLMRLHDGRWFFASTKQILINAFQRVIGKSFMQHIEMLIPLASQHVHTMDGQRIIALDGVNAPNDFRHDAIEVL